MKLNKGTALTPIYKASKEVNIKVKVYSNSGPPYFET